MLIPLSHTKRKTFVFSSIRICIFFTKQTLPDHYRASVFVESQNAQPEKCVPIRVHYV